MQTVPMIDITHSNLPNLSQSERDVLAKVAGYMSGTSAVLWTPSDWGSFPHSGKVRIEQGFGQFQPLSCDVFDVESGALTLATAVTGIHDRIDAKMKWTDVYGTTSTIASLAAELAAGEPKGWYFGHVNCWLADWNLSEAQAQSIVGTQISGITCKAVQFASPTTNPNTLIPGTNITLAKAQADLSVTDPTWFPAPTVTPPTPTVTTGLVIDEHLAVYHVLSKDLKTWTTQ